MAQPVSCDVAFKEWSVAIQALDKGEQVLLIRKGGIREEGKHFRLVHEAFLPYPTYEHQQADLLKPRFAEELAPPEKRDPMTPVELTHYAEVHKAFPVSELAELEALGSYHIWSDAYAASRLRWKPKVALTAIVLRAYRLAQPYTLEIAPEYIGCRSWVSLQEPVALGEMTPVLSDHDFALRALAIDEAMESASVGASS